MPTKQMVQRGWCVTCRGVINPGEKAKIIDSRLYHATCETGPITASGQRRTRPQGFRY